MDEITLDDKTYVSSKRAAEITGYAKDYVGQLCREGRVEARLVGRNWYVLEASIREHRFGAPEQVVPQKTPEIQEQNEERIEESPWSVPRYTTEPAPESIPVLTSVEKHREINVLDKYSEPAQPRIEENAVVEPLEESSSTVKEMQSAWHDWFVRTNELTVSEETLLENPEPTPQEDEKLENMEPVSLERVSEVIQEHAYEPRIEQPVEEFREDMEEMVPLHRSMPPVYEKSAEKVAFNRPQMPVSSPVRSVDMQAVPHAARQAAYIPEPRTVIQQASRNTSYAARTFEQPAQEGRIVRERRVTQKKKPSLILQAVLLSIAGVAIAVTLIGSGLLDSFFNHSSTRYAPVQYLGGENTVNNPSK